MEFFIGLIFDQNSIHYTKIESFRDRFDSKYKKDDLLYLTLISPFTINFSNIENANNFSGEIADILEGHFLGIDEAAQIEFNGISFSMGKKGMLSLTPKIPIDFLYCQESLYSFLKENGAYLKKSKDATNPLLPIARFDFSNLLESAIDIAKLEFSSAFIMNGKNLALFVKIQDQWIIKNNLYSFPFKDHLLNE